MFSLGVAVGVWAWIDAEYGSSSLRDWMAKSSFWLVIFQLIVLLLAFVYPTISIFLIIRMNTALENHNKGMHYKGEEEATQHQWIGPLAAVFVGCIAMIIFRFVNGILLDIVDTKFLCFAIDEDNCIDRSAPTTSEDGTTEDLSNREQEQRSFSAMVKAMPDYAVAIEVDDVDVEAPIVPGIVQQELPPVAEIRIDGSGDICAGGGELVEEGQDAEHGFRDEDERFYEVALDAVPPDCGEGREQNHTRRRYEFC